MTQASVPVPCLPRKYIPGKWRAEVWYPDYRLLGVPTQEMLMDDEWKERNLQLLLDITFPCSLLYPSHVWHGTTQVQGTRSTPAFRYGLG